MPSAHSRIAWTLTAMLLATYWSAVVAFGPLIAAGPRYWGTVGAGIGLLVAFLAGQLATVGYRPGRPAGSRR